MKKIKLVILTVYLNGQPIAIRHLDAVQPAEIVFRNFLDWFDDPNSEEYFNIRDDEGVVVFRKSRIDGYVCRTIYQ